MSAKVYVRLPRVGLGNMLLTWSRGYVFSKLNHLELYTSYWAGVRPGAWLRGEKKKRIYYGYFKEEPVIKRTRLLGYLVFRNKIYEPPVVRLENINAETLFVFNKIFIEYDFFKDLRPYKKTIQEGLFAMLNEKLKKSFDRYEKPVIGVHIRRGDFKIGCKITPVSFFAEVIESIRSDIKEHLPVTVFTDGDFEEIEPLFKLGGVKLAEPKSDILDILLLASSKILITSIGSTFSYWGAFLSEGIIIKHPEEWHAPFRLENDNNFLSEAKWKVRIKEENNKLVVIQQTMQ